MCDKAPRRKAGKLRHALAATALKAPDPIEPDGLAVHEASRSPNMSAFV